MAYTTPQADLQRFDKTLRKISAGYSNHLRILNQEGADSRLKFYSIVVFNKGASPIYILLFDVNWITLSITAPTSFNNRTDFSIVPIPVEAGGIAHLEFSQGWSFESGFTAVASTTNTLVTIAGNDVYFAVKYE